MLEDSALCMFWKFNYSISGIKRKRWSSDEDRDFCAAFPNQIEQKKNVSTAEIRAAQKKFGSLQKRSEAVIRSKMNNIILGKLKSRTLNVLNSKLKSTF